MDELEEGGAPVPEGREPMTEDEFKTLVTACIKDAVDYNETELAPQRERALNAYRGDETDGSIREPGRSQVITREVFESVHLIVPQLAKIFLSGEHVVDFRPIHTDARPIDDFSAADAEAAAAYFQHCFEKSIGVQGFDTLAKDVLISKTGSVKAYFEERAIPFFF